MTRQSEVHQSWRRAVGGADQGGQGPASHRRPEPRQLSLNDETLRVRAESQDAVVIPFPAAEAFRAEAFTVGGLDKTTANELVVRHHYLHRKPHNAYSFGLFGEQGDVLGAVVFGTPASRHLQQGMCPSNPGLVVELNRLWVHDSCPRNSESFFVARALHALPPLLIVSYADTQWGHNGTVYRALNFNYAGWTDMERKTPRYDYIPPDGQHTRESFRGGTAKWTAQAESEVLAGDRQPPGAQASRAVVRVAVVGLGSLPRSDRACASPLGSDRGAGRVTASARSLSSISKTRNGDQ